MSNKKFEYDILDVGMLDEEETVNLLNEQGKFGWEAYFVTEEPVLTGGMIRSIYVKRLVHER